MGWRRLLFASMLVVASCGDGAPDSDAEPSTPVTASPDRINDAEPTPTAAVETVAPDPAVTAVTAVTAVEPVDTEATTTTSSTTTSTTTTTTTSTTTTIPAPRPPTAPPQTGCVRNDIDFAAVRTGPTTDAELIAEIGPGECGVAFTGEVEVVSAAGEMWVEIDIGNSTGWSAARLYDVATLDRRTGLVVAFSQIANRITGGVGGPIVNQQLRDAPGRLGATSPWSGDVDACGDGDTVVCTWFSSDDISEVFIDVRLVFGARGWTLDAVASGSCGGEGCGGLRPG